MTHLEESLSRYLESLDFSLETVSAADRAADGYVVGWADGYKRAMDVMSGEFRWKIKLQELFDERR